MERKRRGGRDAESSSRENEDADEADFDAQFGARGGSLQGLLHRLGAGLEELLPSSSWARTRLKTVMAGLKADADDCRQLDSLTELCEVLTMGNEDLLRNTSADTLVPLLVALLNAEHNPDIMLLASRALSHLMDLMPSWCAAVVHYEAVPLFCARLLSIEYIDLAEQSLQALHKLSIEHSSAIIKCRGLCAVLMFLDFFSTGVQRMAVTTAANLCRNVPADCFELVADAIPNLTELVRSHDQKVVENVCLCFSRLAQSFNDSATKLEQLTAHGVLPQFMNMLSEPSAPITSMTFTLILRFMGLVCRGSPPIVLTLLRDGIAATLAMVLESEASVEVAAPKSVQRPIEQLLAVLTLTNELLPYVPDCAVQLSGDTSDSEMPSSAADTNLSQSFREEMSGLVSAEPHDTNSLAKQQIAAQHSELLFGFAQCIFGQLITVSTTTVHLLVHRQCVVALAKLVYFLPAECLKQLLCAHKISAFLACFLAANKFWSSYTSLLMAELLLEKMPQDFLRHFHREGVVYEIQKLGKLLTEPSVSSPVKPFRTLSGSAVSSSSTPAEEVHDDCFEHCTDNAAAELSAGLTARAAALYQQYFAAQQSKLSEGTNVLQQLKGLASILQNELRCATLNDEQTISKLQDVLFSFGTLLSKPNGITIFEFLSSGMLQSLIDFLTYMGEETHDDLEQCARRLRAFLAVLGSSQEGALAVIDEDLLNGSRLPTPSADSFLACLVRTLQQALNVREQLPVLVSDYSGDVSSGLKVLMEPFKLRLARAPCEAALKDYSSNVVLVEPLATAGAIEDFLWSKVKDDDEKPEDKPEDGSTASAAAPADMEGQLSPVAPGISTAEGTDMGMDGPEDDDGMDETMADSELVERGESAPAGPSSSSTADAAATSSTPAAGTHNLIFLLDEQVLPYKTPLFQALRAQATKRHSAPANDSTGGRVWDKVHTIHYRRVRPSDLAALEEASAQAALLRCAGTTEPYLGGVSLLQPLLKARIPCELQHSNRIYDILVLLRIVDGLNRNWSCLFHASPLFATFVPPSDFISVKISSKLMRQLQDPLTLCSGMLPEWCRQLSSRFNFMFPFEDRRFYFCTTSFGLSRALHAMQQRLSDSQVEFKVGRIPRQKVRLSRARMLESAIKVMEMYSAQRSILEVQFYGEVGTGLGPTLEFYTLVSQEIQRRDLNLWRHEEPVPSQTAAVSTPIERNWCVPVEVTKIKEFHRIAVQLCSKCHMLSFLRNDSELMSVELPDGRPACTNGDSASTEGSCSGCGSTTSLEWWLVSDEEADYVHKAFPKEQETTEHTILQCPRCMSVNFPGTSMSLVVTKDGQMYSVSGRRMYEADYRTVTRHLSSVCDGTHLRELPVKLVATECAALSQLIGSTPEAVEEMPTNDILTPKEYVHNVNGLFPRPFFPTDGEESEKEKAHLTKYFTFIGRLLAKALQDSRLLDLPFAPSFYKLLLQQPFIPADMALIDPALHQSLCKMEALWNQQICLNADEAAALTLDGCTIDSLCLDFTLPGHPEVELKPGGKEIPVTMHNLHEYCALVRRMYMADGLDVQRTALQTGFSLVLDIEHLSVFSVNELEMLIRGSIEPWSSSMLRDAIKCDHGYNADSRCIL
jgi:E3 ubiquitin-protein ligase TRIP12